MVMQWGGAHTERLNLWVLNVGLSAQGRKTSGLAGLRKAVEWARKDGSDHVRYLPVTKPSDAGLSEALDVVGKETAIAQANADSEMGKGQHAAPVEPVVRMVPVAWIAVFNEIAPVWIDEGPGWAIDARDSMIGIYDGYLGRTTRATGVPFQETFVTAVGNIQPMLLQQQTTAKMLASGWVGRWLVVPTPPPDAVISFPQVDSDIDVLDKIRNDVDALIRVSRIHQRLLINDKRRPTWTKEALELRDTWYRERRESYWEYHGDPEMTEATGQLWERLQATAVKVSTLVALSRQLDDLDSLMGLQVEEEDAEWSATLIDSSIGYMTKTIGQSSGGTTSLGRMESKIINKLARENATDEGSSLTMKVVADACRGRSDKYEDVVRAIQSLLDTDQIAVVQNGRTRHIYRVETE